MVNGIYDRERDPRGPLSWWRVSVDELAAGWRWPRWREPKDFGAFLTDVVKDRFRENLERTALRWAQFGPPITPPWWRSLWRRIRGPRVVPDERGPSEPRYGNFGAPVPIEIPGRYLASGPTLSVATRGEPDDDHHG